jgi:hypothetical protein
LLGIYDSIIALGAIYTGVMMVSSKDVFSVFPSEWLSKVPFGSWYIPGIIAIVVFGLGNIIAAFFSFKNDSNRPWLFSAAMGSMFFASIILQVIILEEWYLATLEFLILSMIQISLSIYCFVGNIFNKTVHVHK